MIGEMIGITRLIARQIIDHLGDHIARALEHHAVADAQPKTANLIAVVQRYVGNRHPAHQHRAQPANRGHFPRPANLHFNRFNHCLGAFGGKLVRHCPARRLGDKAQSLLPIKPVDFINDSVDVVRQIGPRRLDGAVMRRQCVHGCAPHQQGRNWQAPSGDAPNHIKLRLRWNSARRAPAMREEPQRARCRYAGILLPQRTGGGVSWIGKELVAIGCLRGIKRREVSFGHVNFAPHLKNIGNFAAELLRNIGNVRHIRGHIFAHLPIPACGGAHQLAMFVP